MQGSGLQLQMSSARAGLVPTMESTLFKTRNYKLQVFSALSPPFPPTLRIPIPPHSLLKNHTWALRASVRGASARNRRRSSSSSCRQRCTTPQDEERGAPLCVRVCVREDIRQSPV